MYQTLRRHLGGAPSRYVITGLCAFAGEYLTFLVLYQGLGAGLILANVLSFCVGLGVSFTGQRQWTFRGDQPYRHHISRQMVLFSILSGLNLLISTGLIQVLHGSLGLAPLIAKVCVMTFIMVWNYVIFRRVIFQRHPLA